MPNNLNTIFLKKIHAWLLAHNIHRYNRLVDLEKRRLFSDLQGDVLEIGAGTGINIQYLPKYIHYVGLEPNMFMHRYLKYQIDKYKLTNAHIISDSAEHIPFNDNSFDIVIGTLVLCTVENPKLILDEIIRVLKPGGRFLFVEHVAASPKTLLRKMQHLFKGIWMVIADGCNPERETTNKIYTSSFAKVQLKEVRVPIRSLISPHVIGIAIK